MIDLTARITIPESVLFRDLDGEAVLLETVTGRYYGLNEVGTRMWSLLQVHDEIEAVCRALVSEYDAPEELLREDLEGAATRTVVTRIRGEDKTITGEEYFLTRALPNFYFHLTTAYALLRKGGVPVGKGDFLA